MASVPSQRALGSLRPTAGFLLPFLYQTKTILRRPYSNGTEINLNPTEKEVSDELRSIKNKWSTRKHASPTRAERTRPRVPRTRSKIEAVPFHGSTGSVNPDERLANTTMTPRELHVFEELFRKGIQAKPREKKQQLVKRAAHEFPELLQPLAQEARELRDQAAIKAEAERRKAEGKQQIEDLDIKDEQSKEIKKLMDTAKTDIELWRVLEKHVFERLQGLGVDRPIEAAKYTALPALLSHYISLMQSYFPGSSLGLALLSSLRSLGPSAFALSASTDLYNQHMRMIWKRYTDVDAVCEILSEMDKEVYAFDEETQILVNEIWSYSRAARKGELGPGVRALWGTDRKERALEKLRGWSRVIGERLESEALRRVQMESVEAGNKGEREDADDEGNEGAVMA